ncbi:unnamed protein product [Lactuca saligna]|uniref:DNA polymerase alpha subunit B OB domain-containing protein n=1 Tax=Lactuca saligna TaxID=75948 RepID=A0AA35VTM6_LACSI|nr:unnamed protein product [Lactuca saligna]
MYWDDKYGTHGVSSEMRLKEKPIMLQSSVEHSGGQRVCLDLQKLDWFSLFPGHLLILLGPFIESEHPEIKKEALNRTYDDLFHLLSQRRDLLSSVPTPVGLSLALEAPSKSSMVPLALLPEIQMKLQNFSHPCLGNHQQYWCQEDKHQEDIILYITYRNIVKVPDILIVPSDLTHK